jgi:hypothetical protein
VFICFNFVYSSELLCGIAQLDVGDATIWYQSVYSYILVNYLLSLLIYFDSLSPLIYFKLSIIVIFQVANCQVIQNCPQINFHDIFIGLRPLGSPLVKVEHVN